MPVASEASTFSNTTLESSQTRQSLQFHATATTTGLRGGGGRVGRKEKWTIYPRDCDGVQGWGDRKGG